MKQQTTMIYGFNSQSKANQFMSYLEKRGIKSYATEGERSPYCVNLSASDDDTDCYIKWYFLINGRKPW